MKRMYQFKCVECEEISDIYTEYKQETLCPECGNKAEKIISAPHIKLEGWSGSFPGAAMKWEKNHRIKQGR